MSNKLKKDNQNLDVKKSKLDMESKIVLGILGVVFALLLGYVIYLGYNSVTENKKIMESLYNVKAPDFTNMVATPSAEEVNTDKTEGTIGFDAFYELRRNKAKENLEKSRGILGDELYVSYLNGLDTDYYKKAVEYDYNDMLNDMDDILKEAGIMEALYNLYDETYDMPPYTTCMDEDCSLLEFIEDYTRDDLHDYLKERHDMWESVLQVESDKTEVTDSYLNLFYQDEICNDISYVDKIQVEVLLLNKEVYDLGFDVLQKAYDNKQLKTKIFDETNKNYFDRFALYKDIDYYDGTFKDLAVDTFQAQFASDVVKNSVYLGQVGTASDANKTLVDKLKEIGAPESDEEVIDYTKLENWNVEVISLGARNENDILYVLWKIVPGSVEHTLQIPAKSSIIDDLRISAKNYLASRKISDTIYAELNELTEDEVHDLLKNNYGYTDEDLDELTEDEMRESLQKEQEKEKAAAQENLEAIKQHMIEDGYDLTGMSDTEIIELYIDKHEGVTGE